MGPSLAENRPKTDPIISGQTAFRYPATVAITTDGVGLVVPCVACATRVVLALLRAGSDPWGAGWGGVLLSRTHIRKLK